MNQPKAGHMQYSDLIRDIDKGIIKIPQFQREFVWAKEQSASLLDSIIKGYPIGTFILWKTNEQLRSVRSVGRIELPETPEGEFVQYVLDGQQRMTSLYASLKGAIVKRDEKKEDNFSEIYIDLTATEEEEIVITNTENMEEGTYIKVTDMMNSDPYDIMEKYQRKYGKKIGEYTKRISTYEFSTITVNDVPIDVATEIFSRINIGGKSLSVFEIMTAKTYDMNRSFDLAEKYNELKERLEEVNYETIPNSTVLQAISMCIKGECSRKHILRLTRDEVIENWDSIIDAFEHAVDYIKAYFRIPVSQILPYDTLIIPFTYFFFKTKKKPLGEQQKYMEDYFWRAVLTSRFSSSVESKLAQDFKKVDQIINGEMPRYDIGVNISKESLESNGWFSVSRAYIKGMLCILASKQPESFIDGSLVNISNAWLKVGNSKNYHHFFPRAYLRKRGIEEWKINHIANITIVDDFLNKREIKDKAPSVYMDRFQSLNSNLEQAMETHLIGNLEEFGIWNDDYERFFSKRLDSLQSQLTKRLVIQKNDIL